MKPASEMTVKMAALSCTDYLKAGIEKGYYGNPIPYPRFKRAVDRNIEYMRRTRDEEIEFSRMYDATVKEMLNWGLSVELETLGDEPQPMFKEAEDEEIGRCEVDVSGRAANAMADLARWLHSMCMCAALKKADRMTFSVSLHKSVPSCDFWDCK